MTKKGSIFITYSEELKLAAVQSYLNGEGSYNMIKEKWFCCKVFYMKLHSRK